jgi:predicted phosphodiesterase
MKDRKTYAKNKMAAKPQSPLDQGQIHEYVTSLMEDGATNATVERRLRDELGVTTTTDSLRRFRKRHGVKPPGQDKAYTRINGDDAEAATKPKQRARHMSEAPVLDDPDTMLRDRGLDPDEWEITSMGVNEWDGPQKDGTVVTYYQAKFSCKRRKPLCELLPPRADGPRRKSVNRTPVKNEAQLIIIVGDHQAPFHDERLHELTCQWLEANQPHRGVHLGDLTDLPDISRHPDDPDNIAVANECLQSGYNILRDMTDSSPATDWELMPGNHDERLRRYVIDKAPRIHGLKRVDAEDSFGEVVHDISFLMRLDELGIDYIDPRGPYDLAQVTLSQNLAVRHGWITSPKGGQSAYKSLEKTGYSILVGHTHRQAIVQHSVPEINGKMRQLLAAEIGCMCRVDDTRNSDDRMFPSYTPMADWQQGFATASVWPDGKFHIELATYVNGVLMWAGQRFE